MVVGYTTGVFDLFHVGHVNLLRNARSMCDRLIVGVTVDELVLYKNKRAVIPFEERIEIVRASRHVAQQQVGRRVEEAWPTDASHHARAGGPGAQLDQQRFGQGLAGPRIQATRR